MARKLGLPLTDDRRSDSETPTIERARQRLGGKGSTSAYAGEIVTVAGSTSAGVVVFASDEECDVFVAAGFVKRTRRANVAPASCTVDSPLRELSAEARVCASLAEGKRVRFEEPSGDLCEGLMFEKCRYGALIAKDDGTVVAVGFRKVWPARAAEA
jgi:hypothetical protein